MTEPKKPFYRRIWFIVASILVLMFALIAAGFYFGVIVRYEEKAAEFDLKKLDEIESASVVYDRYGEVYGKIFIQNREQVSLDQISPNLVNAVISAEDNRFYEHSGVDLWGIFRAAFKNTQAGRIRQGASTLTQQLARNTFDLKDRTYDRKILEVFLAMRIDKAVPKNKILELYLNRVYFGGGLYGAEAAARGYFGKSAKDLSIGESAMLAGLLKSPNNLSPWHSREAAANERDFVLGRMVENHKISEAQAKEEASKPLEIRSKGQVVFQSYLIDFVREQIQEELDLESLVSGGYKIYTTIDPVLQRTAEEGLQRELLQVENRSDYHHQNYADYTEKLKAWKAIHREGGNPPSPEYLQGAVLALDNRTGGILAMVGGRDYGQSEYNRTYQSKRPTGTAFTPFVFAGAFSKGIFPGSLADDSALDNRQVMIGGTTGILGEWGVEREENRYEGPIPLRQVLAESKNAATVRVGIETGLDSVIQLAKQAGIDEDLRPFPATFLGSSEVTLEDMVTAYSTFPGGGTRPEGLFLVARIETQDGKEVFRAQPKRQNVMDPGVAYEVHSFLTDALTSGTGAKAQKSYGLKGFPAAGKTGTAYNFTDAWFVGYDSEITCGVWTGFDKPQTIYRGAFGNDLALPIWTAIMNASLTKTPPRDLGRPIDLKRVEVCLNTGLPASPKCSLLSTVSNDPDLPARKGTFFEFTTPKQMPKERCWLHGDDNRSFVKTLRNQDIPRATTANEIAKFPPVTMQGPTVVGNDPYDSTKPRKDNVQVAQAGPTLTPAPKALPVTTTSPQVRRAEPVGPLDRQSTPPKVDLPPPEHVDLGSDPTNL
ncbi:MAG TPA: PBP1A family penicillin-binding protein [Chthoniobacterales bacterium]